MSLHTAVTALLGIQHPVLSTPMAGISGGALAAAVTHDGGLGFIGGEYGDQTWLTRELKAVGNTRIGIGFISWSLAKQPDLLTLALDREPAAIFLSFGSVRPFSDQIARSSTRLIVQVQDFAQAREALDGGADIVVAQGTEAGGYSGRRATFPLVPTIVDLAGKTPVIAAGGIADGRGLAAALMLGAAGGLCGTAFYASQEALSHPNAKRAAVVASGDETERSSIDVARGLDWSTQWNLRALQNTFTRKWRGDPGRLRQNLQQEQAHLAHARETGDIHISPVIVGEAIDLVGAIEPAADILKRMVKDAERLLREAS
jgi:nitronate monooxygenase